MFFIVATEQRSSTPANRAASSVPWPVEASGQDMHAYWLLHNSYMWLLFVMSVN